MCIRDRLIKLLHLHAMLGGKSRTAKFFRGESADDERGHLKRAQRYPVLRVRDGEAEKRNRKEVIKAGCREAGGERGLPHAEKQRGSNNIEEI